MKIRGWLPAIGVAFALVLALASTPAHAGPMDRRFGLGLVLGEPTGIAAKVFFDESNALNFYVAWDFSDENFGLYVDYLFHLFVIPESLDKVDFPIYVGIGGSLGIDTNDNRDDKVTLGLRIPVGIAVFFTRAPVEVFLEVAPGLSLIPSTNANVDGGIGARYYF